jgi:hypothetical protein
MNLKQIPFNNYVREESAKKQIVLHHTAGGGKGEIVYQGWQADRTPVATCVAVSRDGEIIQGFASRFWGYHLGMQVKHFGKLPYKNLDKQSIGIELCNWGPLTLKAGQYKNYVNGVVDADEVIELEYKGFKYWQKYTDDQIESVRLLLLHWGKKYGVNLEYNEDIWAVSPRALKAESGVFTHNSYRPDKADIYPYPPLIEMLKNLEP